MNFNTKYIFLLMLVLFSCAVKAPPTGGEQDTRSPYIIEVSPKNGSINLSDKNNIEINFNEMIDPNSIKSSIEIYPDIEIQINRYGKKIVIRPKDEWPLDKIFKIKLKRGISDYFGNKLESGMVLTYSTSNKISDGFIEGKIFNNNVISPSTIALYKIINNELFYYDSIENDKSNMYSFENIENGDYVVIAIENDIKDIYNDIEKYNYGIYHEAIQLSDKENRFNDINIMFSYPDYKDEIIYLTSYNNFYGEAEFLSGDKILLINEVLRKDTYSDNDSYILKAGSPKFIKSYSNYSVDNKNFYDGSDLKLSIGDYPQVNKPEGKTHSEGRIYKVSVYKKALSLKEAKSNFIGGSRDFNLINNVADYNFSASTSVSGGGY